MKHKRPQAENHQVKLINTTNELIKQLSRVIFKPNNHLSAALCYLSPLSENQEDLYQAFKTQYKRKLQFKRYQNQISQIMTEHYLDARAALSALPEKVKIKHILMHPVNLARELLLWLSLGNNDLEHTGNVWDALERLEPKFVECQEGKLLTQWKGLINELMLQRILHQSEVHSNSSQMDMVEIERALKTKLGAELTSLFDPIITFTKTMQEQYIPNCFEEEPEYKYTSSIAQKTYYDELPLVNKCLPRQDLVKEVRSKLVKYDKTAIVQKMVACGLGGIGKSQLSYLYARKHISDYHCCVIIPAETPAQILNRMRQFVSAFPVKTFNKKKYRRINGFFR